MKTIEPKRLAMLLRPCVFIGVMMAAACLHAESYSYDAAGRLTGVIYDNGSSITYAYDANSNLASVTIDSTDEDGDGILDDADNCTYFSNASQLDTNGDGSGNACDADLNNDGITNFADLALFRSAYATSTSQPGYNPDADLNGDGVIDSQDLNMVRSLFFKPPNPQP
jgi:YD repeat-containing protein